MKQLSKYTILFLGIALLPLVSAGAETRFESVQIRLGWQDVAGNQGYAIEVEDASGQPVLSVRSPRNEAKLDLKPGEYRLRIAAINKFGKPSVWTDWNELSVTGRQKVQEFTAQAEKKKEPAPSRYRLFSPDYMVPGKPRLDRRDPLGYGWIALFSGITLYGLSEKNAGTVIAHKSMNDPVYLSVLSYATGASLPVMLYLRQNREADHTRYRTMQDHQRVAAGAFVLFYALHYLDSVRLSAQPAKNVELFLSPSLDTAALFAGGAESRHGLSPGALSALSFGITMRY